jgi:hypothetical protein
METIECKIGMDMFVIATEMASTVIYSDVLLLSFQYTTNELNEIETRTAILHRRIHFDHANRNITSESPKSKSNDSKPVIDTYFIRLSMLNAAS